MTCYAYVRPRVSREDATRLYSRFSFRPVAFFLNLLGCARKPPPPLRVELVWLPHYLVVFRLWRRGTNAIIRCLVESYTGAFSVLESEAHFEKGQIPDGECFPSGSSFERAERCALQMMAISSLANKQLRGAKVAETLSTELVFLPFWICHFERSDALRDFVAIDALSGKRVPAKIRTALIRAMIGVFQAGRKTDEGEVYSKTN